MSINVTDEIEVKTIKGKLGAAKQIFLEGDTTSLQKEHEDNQDHFDTLYSRSAQMEETIKSIAATGGASQATAVTYDNANSQLTAINIQSAVDELQVSKIDKTSIAQDFGNSENLVMSQKAITDWINNGYQFRGVATPTTNPGTPDGPVFYLATEQGIYSNFSGIELTEGEVAILQWDNGVWHKKLTGIASDSRLFGSDRVLASDEINIGSYRTISGNLSTVTSYFYSNPIKLYKGESVFLDNVNSNQYLAIVSEVDENNNWISCKVSGTGTTVTTTWVADREMFISISAQKSSLPQITIKFEGIVNNMQLKLDEHSDEIDELKRTTQEQSRNFENYSERLSTDGVTKGKYRLINGTLADLSSYFYSNPILLHKGESIVASLDSVSNTVAVLSVVDAENNWISLIQSGTTPTEVSYTATEDIYIGISALNKYIDSFVINRISTIAKIQASIDNNSNRIEQNASNISKNTKSIEEINKSIESVSYQLGTDDKIKGSYRNIDGILVSMSAYFYTNPIKIIRGDKVIITDANIPTIISIISEVDESNNFISVIYAVQGEIASHIFTAPRDMFISFSTLNSQAETITIESNGILRRLTTNEDNVKDLQKILIDNTIGLETTDVVTGNYRVIDGSIKTMVGYFYSNPILLYKGDRIVTTSEIATSQYVSIISRVDAENNFISVLKAATGSNEIIDFTITETCYISISALNGQRTSFALYCSGIVNKIDSLYSDISSILPAADTKLHAINDNPLSSIRRDAGYGAIIRKWGIIGDSLSSGEMQCYDNTSTSASDYKFIDMYQYSWGQVFARIIGAEAYNFSNGGQTTLGWLKGQGIVHNDSYIGGVGGGDWELAKQDDYKKEAYIIALGVNDRAKIKKGEYVLGDVSQITNYDGTNSDIDDISINPKSFVRYYAGIIQRVKSIQPKAKIFCVTPLGSNYAEIAQAIRDIVEHYSSDGVYLIDLFNYIPKGYNVDGYMLNGHLSPMGYTYTAYMMNTYIDWIIRNNGSAFRDTALIGTEYRPDYE